MKLLQEELNKLRTLEAASCQSELPRSVFKAGARSETWGPGVCAHPPWHQADARLQLQEELNKLRTLEAASSEVAVPKIIQKIHGSKRSVP